MNYRTNWQVPLLGTALLAALAISGCGATNGNNPGIIGFTNDENGGNNNNNNVGGSATSAAPFLLVANSNSVAEFSLNGSTGALVPVTFNNGANTINVGDVPSCVQSIDLANGTSAIYVGTADGIAVFTVSNSTGLITPLQVNGAQFIESTGGPILSLGVLENTAGIFLYSLSQVGDGELESFTINADGSLAPTAGAPNTTTNIAGPVQLLPLNIGAAANIYVANRDTATVSVYQTSVATGTAGNPSPLVVTAAGGVNVVNGALSVPVSLGVSNSNNGAQLLVADSGNNAVTVFQILQDGSLPTAANGQIIGNGINGPTAVTGQPNTSNFTVSSTAGGGTGDLASFSLAVTNNILTISPAPDATTNSVTAGVNLPQSVGFSIDGGTEFCICTNEGGGTGSVAVFSAASSGLLTAVTTIGGANTITTGIDVPALNPLAQTVVTGI